MNNSTRKFFIAIIITLGITTFSYAQTNENWNWLLGKWEGKGSGKPGEGGGIFTFEPQLENNIIVRKSHSEYPATEKNPKTIHEDLMIVYRSLSKAIYFDNEGHSINYDIAYSDKTITFLSEKIPNVPFFRLTYTLLENNSVNTKFEISQDGKDFNIYIEGISIRTK